jgi:hypothetical protein
MTATNVTPGRTRRRRARTRRRAAMGVAAALAVAALSAAALSPALAASADDEPYLEYEVKAAFVYNLGKFVEWPPQSFASTDSEFVFCVLAPNPFRGSLRSVLRDKKVRGRPTRLRSQVPMSLVEKCHVLFVPAAADAAAPRAIATATPILVIGESERFFELGGMVRLVVEEGGVRFDINAAAAEAAGLRLSSQLLKLARRVER